MYLFRLDCRCGSWFGSFSAMLPRRSSDRPTVVAVPVILFRFSVSLGRCLVSGGMTVGEERARFQDERDL